VVELATRLTLDQEILGSSPSLGAIPFKEKIIALLEAGWSYRKIVAELGCSSSTVSYHGRKLGRVLRRKGTRYDWEAIRSYYEQGHSLPECQSAFGFSRGAWNDAVGAGKIVPRDHRIPVEELTRAGRATRRTHLKNRLLRAGVLKNECSVCGLTEWQGKPLSLVLDHINGVNDDNDPGNLRLLRPNCHSQTDTFSGRNIKRKRAAQGSGGA
jgi:hypothetical protein